MFLSRRSKVSATSSQPISGHITTLESRPWNLLREADQLFAELERLYWVGIEHELESVLFTLKSWQHPQFKEIDLAEESDTFVHGFDTFIDQVCEGSREFAEIVGGMKDKREQEQGSTYMQALKQSTHYVKTERESSRLKAAIREATEEHKLEPLLHRRTRMLLQGIGLLDIEKLVEYRPPLDEVSFWKRPAIPQLHLVSYTKGGEPILTSLRCSSCSKAITGSMYSKEITGYNQNQNSRQSICETCYRDSFREDLRFLKAYKHCILDTVMTPRISRNLCMCDTVPHYDQRGKALALFPVGKNAKHRQAAKPGMVECGLLKLRDIVAEAKFDGFQETVGHMVPKLKTTLREEERAQKLRSTERKQKHAQQLTTIGQKSMPAPERIPEEGTSLAVEEDEADKDIPFFLKRFTEKYPFGNVHMALRIGPIVVENGVAK